MDYLIIFFIFILGASIGSFLNVIVFRYGTGFSIINSRSKCFSCGNTLKWFELIPIFSFIIQKTRCRSCGSKIAIQYVLVEALTGLVFLLVFLKILFIYDFLWLNFGFVSLLIYYLLVFSVLIAISVYDFRHKIIPNGLVYFFIAMSFLRVFFDNGGEIKSVLFSGFITALPLFLLWLLSKGRWMGFGDVKLALGIGFFLGFPAAIYSLIWTFWFGGIFGILILILRSKSYTIKSEIPFGPFLVLGTLFVFLIEWDFLNFKIFFLDNF